MGGVPMLLVMIAATGVTYGWQPDKSGDEATAVEYIVQVSPNELAEIERIGEISSVIDPEVRGHVSRIVIRVGSGSPPRILPKALAQGRVASLKPDPQGPDAQRGGFSMPSSLKQSASNAAAGATNALRGAVDQAGRDLVGQGQQKANNLVDHIRGRGQASNEPARVSPPSTRRPTTSPSGTSPRSDSNPFSAPAFTGSSDRSTLAQTRSGGPSTDPTSSRDNAWDRYGANASRPNAQVAGPSTADRNMQARSTQTREPQARSTQSRSATGLGASDTFGRMPAGLSDVASRDYDRNSRSTTAAEDYAKSQNSYGDQGIYTQIGQSQQDFASGRGSSARSTQTSNASRSQDSRLQGTSPRGYQAPAFADRDNDNGRLQSRNSNLTRAEINAGGWDYDAYDRLIDRDGNVINSAMASAAGRGQSSTDAWLRDASNSQTPNTASFGLGDPAGRDQTRRSDLNQNSRGQQDSNWPATVANRDTTARSTNNPLGYGYPATNSNSQFSQDMQNRQTQPFNGNGPLMPSVNTRQNSGQGQLAGNGYPYPAAPSIANQGYNNQAPMGYSPSGYGNQTGYLGQPSNQNPGFNRDATMIAARQPPLRESQPRQTARNNLDQDARATSMSDLDAAATSSARTPPQRPKQVAAQPLFNGLLLVSFVANIYLLFWLKRIRLQFRDLVAAKRVATSAAVSAT